MINLEVLKNQFKELSINCYEVNSNIDDTQKIEFISFDNLLAFAFQNNIKNFFYEYSFASAENLIINEDIFLKLHYDVDILNILSNEIKSYNKKIEELDFSKPFSIDIFCINQGFIYLYSEYDFWFTNFGIEKPENALIHLMDKHLQKIITAKKEKENWVYKERNKLKEKILADPKFHKCTNSTLRNVYLRELLKENPEIHNLFYSEENQQLYDIPSSSFIEIAWREFKINKNK